MARFCDFQKKTNQSGIGNECTHVVYAALYEVDAMDGASDVNLRGTEANPMVRTSRVPYHWGRRLQAGETRAGDVVQFDDVVQTVYLYSEAQGRWFNDVRKRRPHHTGIMYNGAGGGSFDQYEAHITQTGFTLMEVRVNRIFHETFAVALSDADLNKKSGLVSYIKQYAGDTGKLFEMVNWSSLRSSHPASVLSANQLKRAFDSGAAPAPGAAVFFQVNVTGEIRFYRPQVSQRRQRMTRPAERAAEKTRLIGMMRQSGRAGAQGFNWDWQFRDQ
jgi:hypothetical protein